MWTPLAIDFFVFPKKLCHRGKAFCKLTEFIKLATQYLSTIFVGYGVPHRADKAVTP